MTKRLENSAGEERLKIEQDIIRLTENVKLEKTRLVSLEEEEQTAAENFEKELEADMKHFNERKLGKEKELTGKAKFGCAGRFQTTKARNRRNRNSKMLKKGTIELKCF